MLLKYLLVWNFPVKPLGAKAVNLIFWMLFWMISFYFYRLFIYQNSAGSDGKLFTSVCLSDGLSNIVIMGELRHLFSVMWVIQSIALYSSSGLYLQMTPFPPCPSLFIILPITYAWPVPILSALFKLAARLYHLLHNKIQVPMYR